MGFDHVRLPVDPAVLAQDGAIGTVDPDALYYLEDAVRLVLDGGLAIVIDLHPDESFGLRLPTEPATLDRIAALWTQVARTLGDHDPDRVYFEVLNEPGIDGRRRLGADPDPPRRRDPAGRPPPHHRRDRARLERRRAA